MPGRFVLAACGLAVLSLTACVNESSSLLAGFRLNQPTIAVDSTTVEKGNPVTVMLTGSAFSDSQNPNREEHEARLKLGACFAIPPQDSYEGTGLCNIYEQDVTGVQLLNDSSYVAEILDVTLRPGEEWAFDHSFTFTMPEAGVVVVTPFLVADRPEGGRMSGDEVSVTFQ